MEVRSTTVIVPTVLGGERLGRMLGSLAVQSLAHQTIVVDNGSPAGAVALPEELDGGQVLRLEENLGYTRAINMAARLADGEVVVLLNDDCVVEPDFVERISARIDPAAGIAMAAGVMRDWRHRSLIDSAGMELDRTLLVIDYLNGAPLTILERPVDDPVGPSGAAAAFDRETFVSAGGFDERLFAYYEDVDLVLRLRREGIRCALAHDAIGDHEHSATLGSGSARKNYLMGFGRGYVLRKWNVLTPRRVGAVLARDGVLCVGQGIVDRNLSGLRGRVRGYRSAEPDEPYPRGLPPVRSDRATATLARRARRRVLLRTPAPARTDCARHARRLPSRRDERAIALVGGRDALARRRRAADRDRARTGIGRARARRGRRAGGARLRRPDDALRRAGRHARGGPKVRRRRADVPARDPRSPPTTRDPGDDDAAGRRARCQARAGSAARLLRRAAQPPAVCAGSPPAPCSR